MKRRVLIFSLAYYPSYVSGAEAAVREITDRIAPDDIEFELITLRFDGARPRAEQIGRVLVHRIGFGPTYLAKMLFVPLAAWTARKLHNEKPFDGLWALMTYMLFPIVLARFLGVRLPYVVTLQDGDPYERVFERWFIKLAVPLLDYGFKHATVIQAISVYLATWSGLRGSHAPVEIVYNGGNPGDFENAFDEVELDALKQKYGIRPDNVVLMTASRLEHKNAVDDIIRALALLPPHMVFLLVGGGTEEGALKELAKTLGVAERVRFVGQIDRTEVSKYRKIAHIFVRPSRSEGLGNALLSAMAAHLPVIATQEGGIADFLFDEKRNPDKLPTGWAVDPNCPEQIFAAVQDIVAHPDKVARITNTAFDMVSKQFQWDSIANTMREKVFARLFGEHVASKHFSQTP